ncbi:co-chaperone HscB [uncultured Paraglaciecola sp.]|mgnify:CR=1 FL=1|uniref:co-chaperone HscB n=1 Tax=uncultured Paraglaciecola sp. TaxID=1765024 RepID=UPI0030DA7929|tara:strand:+ start:56338 stop:56865 length:528 start_codon:yes stop_codon:yes gene_type:complete
MNYFELFNIPVSFDVDLSVLPQTYQQLQRLTHPDKFASGSEQQKLVAIQKNAQVNDAYSVLKSPLSRAEYLLSLRGIDLQHEQQTIKDTGFLMQQMEWREELAEITDQTDPLAALSALEDEIKQTIKNDLAQLKEFLESEQANAVNKAADIIRQLKFLYKMLTEIELKEDSLSDF